MTLRLRGSTSGYAEINAPAVAGDNSLTLPTTTGTIRITNPSGVDGDYTVGTGATISGSTNTITASTNGEERLRIDSSGDIEIMQGKNLTWVYEGGSTHRARIRAESTDALIFENGLGNTEQLRITSAGNVGIGTDSTTSKLHINGTVRSDEGYTVYPPSDSNYAFATRNAANDQWTAFIEANGKATFAGNVVFSTSGSGIDFSATSDAAGMTSELLDDYEEGTWTPTIRENGTGTEWDTISDANGYYTKIGDCVTFAGTFNYSGVATNVNTSYYGWLAGFPFASSVSKKAGQFFISFLYSGVRNVLYSGTFIQGNVYAGIYKDQDATSPGTMRTNEYPTGAHTVQFQGHYYV